jgi:ubiquinone/menaquinone biosynthesis C-methylase UbiE
VTEPAYIHGGTDAREVARLEKQARWLSPMMLKGFDAAPGMRVLDLATGVGAMAGRLLHYFPGIHVTGVDLSRSQLATAAANQPAVAYAHANGVALPFPDATFDRVHCSWLLEHVSKDNAVRILRETRRVLKPGAYAHFNEVDNSTFHSVPELPRVLEAFSVLNAAQQRAGGDPFVGPKVAGYAREAGFSRVDSRLSLVRGDGSDLGHFQAFVEEFVEIFESIDEAVGAPLHEAIAELKRLPTLAGASLEYRGTIAQLHR